MVEQSKWVQLKKVVVAGMKNEHQLLATSGLSNSVSSNNGNGNSNGNNHINFNFNINKLARPISSSFLAPQKSI